MGTYQYENDTHTVVREVADDGMVRSIPVAAGNQDWDRVSAAVHAGKVAIASFVAPVRKQLSIAERLHGAGLIDAPDAEAVKSFAAEISKQTAADARK